MLIPYLFQTLTSAYWKYTAVPTRVTTRVRLEATSVHATKSINCHLINTIV